MRDTSTAGAFDRIIHHGVKVNSEDREWLEWQTQMTSCYDSLNYEDNISGFFLRKSHMLAEFEFNNMSHFSKVLEVGTGTGQHLSYVRHGFCHYYMSDINHNILKRAQMRSTPHRDGITHFVASDCANLCFPNRSFDRLIAIHVLEHIYFPHKILKEWKRVVKKEGTITIVLPTDPGFAWRIARIYARRKAIRLGIAYDLVMAREHVNPINNLVSLIHHYFKSIKEIWFPFCIPSMDLNFYYCCHIRND